MKLAATVALARFAADQMHTSTCNRAWPTTSATARYTSECCSRWMAHRQYVNRIFINLFYILSSERRLRHRIIRLFSILWFFECPCVVSTGVRCIQSSARDQCCPFGHIIKSKCSPNPLQIGQCVTLSAHFVCSQMRSQFVFQQFSFLSVSLSSCLLRFTFDTHTRTYQYIFMVLQSPKYPNPKS